MEEISNENTRMTLTSVNQTGSTVCVLLYKPVSFWLFWGCAMFSSNTIHFLKYHWDFVTDSY